MEDPCFLEFKNPIEHIVIPTQLNDPFDTKVSEIGKMAVAELQNYLVAQQSNWKHNFGFSPNKSNTIKAKMFGVLVVKSTNGNLGYLAGYSGKLSAPIPHSIFVPSLFDITVNDSAFSKGMSSLTLINDKIKSLQEKEDPEQLEKIADLKAQRKSKSLSLQKEMLCQYHFLNSSGQSKSIYEIFEDYNSKLPPGGAGDCAAPKLLQYAFKHNFIPLAIAEFWWGTKSTVLDKEHKSFYPACNEKCLPILDYMLGD